MYVWCVLVRDRLIGSFLLSRYTATRSKRNFTLESLREPQILTTKPHLEIQCCLFELFQRCRKFLQDAKEFLNMKISTKMNRKRQMQDIVLTYSRHKSKLLLVSLMLDIYCTRYP